MAVSQYDKEHLSTDQQGQIDAITKAAEAGSMDWGTAHSLAEGIRSKAAGGGYSGGAAGNEYNPLSGGNGIVGGNSGNTGSGSLNNTDWYGQFLSGIQSGADYDTLNSYYQNRVAKTAPGSQYEQYSGDDAMGFMQQYLSSMQQNDAMQQIKDAIAQIQNQNYSYGGSAWDSKLDELAQAAIDFNYNDWANSDQYKALADRYGYQGNLTMQDVLGQIASRTGGLASSYATTAAQQQYNDYMAQLESVARSQYSDEKNSMLDNATLAQNMSETEYQRYLNELSAKQSGQSEALNALFNLMGVQTDAANTAYNRQQSEDETAYNRGQTGKTDAQNRIYDYLVNQGGSVGDLDAELITTSGYTTAELNAMEAKYKENAAAAASKSSGGGSSGGGGSGSGSGSGSGTGGLSGKPTLTAAQTLAAINDGIINDTTKYAYEYYYGQSYAGDAEEDVAADAQISNRHGDSWIYIPGHGRFSYQEVENYISSGKIIETYDKSTNTYSYKWYTNKAD